MVFMERDRALATAVRLLGESSSQRDLFVRAEAIRSTTASASADRQGATN
jgi:hypothetical protein